MEELKIELTTEQQFRLVQSRLTLESLPNEQQTIDILIELWVNTQTHLFIKDNVVIQLLKEKVNGEFDRMG